MSTVVLLNFTSYSDLKSVKQNLRVYKGIHGEDRNGRDLKLLL